MQGVGERSMNRALLVTLMLVAIEAAGQQLPFQPSLGGSRIDAPAILLDTWGTASQCQAHRAGIVDDMRRLPYVIGEQWIRHGVFYCWINWLGHRELQSGAQTHAILQCGEDTLRSYDVLFRIEQDRLRIRWSKDFTTRALERCR